MDDDISLSRRGIKVLHDRIALYQIHFDTSIATIRERMLLSRPGTGDISTEIYSTYTDKFEMLITLFSGFPAQETHQYHMRTRISALASNGIYCYVNLLREPFSSWHQASRIHLGRGCIQTASRTYTKVLDADEDRLLSYRDTIKPPKSPLARAIVDENATLRFHYERWDDPYFEQRHGSNPMTCIGMGWDGHRGAWRGWNTWSADYHMSYLTGSSIDPNDTELEQNHDYATQRTAGSPRPKQKLLTIQQRDHTSS